MRIFAAEIKTYVYVNFKVLFAIRLGITLTNMPWPLE